MALSSGSLYDDLKKAFEAKGFKENTQPTGKYTSINKKFIEAIADAVVKNIQKDSFVQVDANSHQGKVQ